MPNAFQNNELPAPSTSCVTSSRNGSSRRQYTGSPISALFSSACQRLRVGPAGGGTICDGPMLLCKLQAAKEAAWSPANANKVGSRLQDIAKEGGPGNRAERCEEEVQMKELQSQKA